MAGHVAGPEQLAAQYVSVDKGVADVCAALDGARYILKSRKALNSATTSDHHEALNSVPSHRTLAMLRGRNEGIL